MHQKCIRLRWVQPLRALFWGSGKEKRVPMIYDCVCFPENGSDDPNELWANLASEFTPKLYDSVLRATPPPGIQCSPAPGPFLPCNDLFDWWTLRCSVWIVFLLALLGNGCVVIVLIASRGKMDVPRFLVCNLAMADFFMGLYLGQYSEKNLVKTGIYHYY